MLIAARALIPHGDFENWHLVEFEMSIRTLQQWMSIARLAALHDDITRYGYTVGALELLALRKTPAQVLNANLAAVRAGQTPATAAAIQAQIAERRAEQNPEPDVPGEAVAAPALGCFRSRLPSISDVRPGPTAGSFPFSGSTYAANELRDDQ